MLDMQETNVNQQENAQNSKNKPDNSDNKRSNGLEPPEMNENKPDKPSKKRSKIFIGIIVAILLIGAYMVHSSSNKSTIVDVNEGMTILKQNSLVDEAIIQDPTQQVFVKLKKPYVTRKKVRVDKGKTVVFGWTLGQREYLGKLLLKSNYTNGYQAVGYRSSLFNSIISSLIPMLVFFGIIILFTSRFSTKIFGGGATSAKFTESKDGRNSEVTFDNVKGINTALDEIKEVSDMVLNQEKYSKMGAHLPHGIILAGEPGTGKTLLAKALSNEADANFYYCSASSFVEMFVGLGASRVRDIFQAAREDTHKHGKKPRSIIFIDEIDAIGGNRSSIDGNSEREQTLNQLLIEMDGFNSSDKVFVIAATNRIDVLDKALLRPGRFDRSITIPLPDLQGRLDILQVHSLKTPIKDRYESLKWVARNTPGFTGAQLANIINESAILAVRDKRENVEIQDLSEAIDRTILGMKLKNRHDYQKNLKATAYHEAGHALVALANPNSDDVTKITILPRANALGYTSITPSEDVVSLTEPQLEAKLAHYMGGWAAEQLIFNHVSTGVASDIEQATKTARAMTLTYGMSAINTNIMANNTNMRGVAWGAVENEAISDKTKQQIDESIELRISRAKTYAINTIKANMDVFEDLVKLLLEKETLTQDEIEPFKSRIKAI